MGAKIDDSIRKGLRGLRGLRGKKKHKWFKLPLALARG